MKSSRHGRPIALAEKRFQDLGHLLRNKSLQDIFTIINVTNLWGSPTSHSGLGSEFLATATIRSEIPKLMLELKA